MSKRKRGGNETQCPDPLPVHASIDTSPDFPREPGTLVICGGQVAFRGGPVNGVLLRSKGVWSGGGELSEARTAAGATVFNGSVVIVGGAGSGPTPANRKASVEARRFAAPGGAAAKEWPAASLPLLGSPRMSPGVAVVGNALWAIGGCNGKRVLKTTEFLLPGAEAWMPGPDLPVHGRFGSTTVALGPDVLVACGGRGGGDVMLRSADLLRVARASAGSAAPSAVWAPVASMAVARAFAAAVAPPLGPWAGLLVVSGGQTGSGSKVTGSVELYSPETDAWRPGPSLLTPRYGHVMWVEPDGSLGVAGGRDASGAYLASCERLSAAPAALKAGKGVLSADPGGPQWVAAGDLPQARFRAAAAFV